MINNPFEKLGPLNGPITFFFDNGIKQEVVEEAEEEKMVDDEPEMTTTSHKKTVRVQKSVKRRRKGVHEKEMKMLQELGTSQPFSDMNRELMSEDIDGGLKWLCRNRKNVVYWPASTLQSFFDFMVDDPQTKKGYTDIIQAKTRIQYAMCGIVLHQTSRHWMLFLLDIRVPKFFIFNSVKMSVKEQDKVIDRVIAFLNTHFPKNQLNTKKTNYEAYAVRYMTIPVQKPNDYTNCGVYVLEFAKLYLEHQLVITNENGITQPNSRVVEEIDIESARNQWNERVYG